MSALSRVEGFNNKFQGIIFINGSKLLKPKLILKYLMVFLNDWEGPFFIALNSHGYPDLESSKSQEKNVS
jgi:hypothetical protein